MGKKSYVALVFLLAAANALAAPIRVMSFNIWSNWRDRDVTTRCAGIERTIARANADVVLLQEYAGEWKKSPVLDNLTNTFGIVERNCLTPVLYRKERLRPLASGRDTFNETLDGSKSVAWTVLEDRIDGRRFIAFSTHLWHREGKESDAVRESSAKLIMARVADVRRTWGDIPALGGGDLNSRTGSVVHLAFRAAGWRNAMDAAIKRTERSFMCTYHGYPVKDANGIYHGTLYPPDKNTSDRSIDHVFLSPGIDVLCHDLDTDQVALDASDHSPVIVDCALSGGDAARTLFLAGDSTLDAHPSWGTELGRHMKPGNSVRNFAKCGASTKSFRESGQWARLIGDVKTWDFVIIQFGHNDQKQSTEFYRLHRYTSVNGTYEQNLSRFVAEVRARGGIPVFATSLSRCTFDASGKIYDKPDTADGDSLRTYVSAVLKLGQKLNVDVVDMNAMTRTFLEKEGKEDALKLFVQKKGEDGKIVQDVSHPAKAGAEAFSKLFLASVKANQLPIAYLFK